MKRLFMILAILVMAFFCGACGAKKEQQAVTEGSESESVTESEESREETSSRADDAEAIPGYYRMVELRRGDEIAADRAYIEEELEPEYGLYYLEVAEDGNAVLQVAGVKLSLTCDFEEKVLRAGAEIGDIESARVVDVDRRLLQLASGADQRGRGVRLLAPRHQVPRDAPGADVRTSAEHALRQRIGIHF